MKFFKLARQITESAIWDDGTPFDKAHAWIDLLMYVNWADAERPIRGEIVKVKRGSQFTSDKFLANRWHWSRNRVRRFLDTLERAGMVTVHRTSIGTYINVVNYSKFQDKRTGNRTGNGTSGGTSNGTGGGTQLYKNLEEKEIENNFFSAPAQKKLPPAKSDIEAYCREKKYKFDIGEFMTYYDMRGWELSNGKKMTDWKAAVDYWHRHDRKMANEGGSNMPCFELYEENEVRGTAPKFDGGLVAEMKRKRKEKA